MIIRLVRTGALGLVLCASASAQNLKFNQDLARELIRDRVWEFDFTQDGSRVVYGAFTPGTGLRLELFSRPLDRSLPSIRLNGPLSGQGTVFNTFTFGERTIRLGAGGRAVFAADEDGDRAFELYSAPADGSASRIRLSDPGPSVALLALDPAGSRAVYKHLVGFSGYGSLHVVPVDGSAAPLTLVVDPVAGKAWVTPDGTRVVYSVNDPIHPFLQEDLFVEPLDGSGAALFLSATPLPGGFFFFGWTFEDLVFTPDGAQVVYHQTQDVDGDFTRTLHSVPLDASRPAIQVPGYGNGSFNLVNNSFVMVGSSPPRLAFRSGATVLSTNVDGSLPATLSPAGFSPLSWPRVFGTEVYFRASSTAGQTIFRAPGDGSQAATQLVSGGERISDRFTLASPQTLAFIRGGFTVEGQAFVQSLAGGSEIPLHPPPPVGQGTFELIPHPDGQRILFRGDLDANNVTDLYVAPLDASVPPIRLDEPSSPNSDVLEARISPGGALAAYQAQDVPRLDLLAVPVDASRSPELLNESRLGAVVGDVTHFQLSRDGRWLVFRADQIEDEHFDLFAVSTGAPGTPHSLTANLPSVLDGFAWIEPGPRVVFRTASSLYVADASGRPPIQLDSSAQGFGADVVASSAGRRLVYQKQIAAGGFELRSVVLDGLSAPVRLHAALPSLRTVTAFRVAADDTVVFRSDLGQNDVFELYAVAAKGGAPRRLNAPLVTRGDVESFEVEPTGKFVAFLADAVVDGRVELFALPLDGSPPERRSGIMPAWGDVVEFAFAGDGRHLVYRANQLAPDRFDRRFDLFSTPILSSFGPKSGPRRSRTGTTPLTAVPANRAVQPDWRCAADGSAVVYRANPFVLSELFRVPVDGSARPTRLSGALVAGGNVTSFAITPERAVYLADQRFNDRTEIFSVLLADGTAVALDALPGGDVLDFRIAPGSREVVFRADHDTDQVFELYRAPLDGTTPALRVSGPLTFGGNAQPDFVGLDELTLYRADQESDEVFELFETR